MCVVHILSGRHRDVPTHLTMYDDQCWDGQWQAQGQRRAVASGVNYDGLNNNNCIFT